MKRYPHDRTVQRYQAPDGLHIAWEDSSNGEIYGSVLHGDAADSALRADDLDPNEFWAEVRQV